MLIGFSGKALSGKDTAADYLIGTYGWGFKVGFSYNLKDACSEIFHISKDMVYSQEGKSTVLRFPIVVGFDTISCILAWMSKTHDVSLYSREYKHLLGRELKTPREILQFVGTDVMRYYLPSYHVDVALLKAKELGCFSNGSFVDVRFPNEAAGIKSLGGILVRIVRPDKLRGCSLVSSASVHDSEVALDSFTDWDYVIYNDTNDLNDYYEKLDLMLEELERRNAITNRECIYKEA